VYVFGFNKFKTRFSFLHSCFFIFKNLILDSFNKTNTNKTYLTLCTKCTKKQRFYTNFAFLLLVICRYSLSNFLDFRHNLILLLSPLGEIGLRAYCQDEERTSLREREISSIVPMVSRDPSSASHVYDGIVKFGTNGALETLVKFLFLTSLYIQIDTI